MLGQSSHPYTHPSTNEGSQHRKRFSSLYEVVLLPKLDVYRIELDLSSLSCTFELIQIILLQKGNETRISGSVFAESV